MSLFMDGAVVAADYHGNSIANLTRAVDRVSQEQALLKQAHHADLAWVTGELKAILASWGEEDNQVSDLDKEITRHLGGLSAGEARIAAARQRVQHLAETLSEKMEEVW